ncbi:CDP-glycerol glycerophosphotransferase family protein [uncultured Microbulbifer sp.]|uniref:CDP-glycerol glycerophosphotransferase family protein n=1 Tax=uncultured Microbulbifer sp. TaxID=348147 RepID=UPI00262F89A6|nr:CDP-glycerol glycerophosphotransferase family protein [uncultured Microbulbifer sp.]
MANKIGQVFMGVGLAALYVSAYFHSLDGSSATLLLCMAILMLRKLSLRVFAGAKSLLGSLLGWSWPFLFVMNSLFTISFLHLSGSSLLLTFIALAAVVSTVFSVYFIQRSSKSRVRKSTPVVHLGFESASSYIRKVEKTFKSRPEQIATNMEGAILLALSLFYIDSNLIYLAGGGLLVVVTISTLCGLNAISLSSRPVLTGKVQAPIVSGAVKDYQPDLFLYYFGGKNSLYQVISWLPILNATNFRVMVVLRQGGLSAKLRKHTSFPIVQVPKFTDLGLVVNGSTARGAIYVNNSIHNGHFARFNELKHILLLHGESDKASSSNSFSKIYDKLYVAGEAAIDRYKKNKVYIPECNFEIIGRPQIDGVIRESDSGHSVEVLYAPTFEGYHSDASYSSLLRFGMQIVVTVLSCPEVHLRFRPHPLTGTVNEKYRQVLDEILVRFSSEPRFIFDVESKASILEDFNASSALITDVSSVCVDYLPSQKPLIVTNPSGLQSEAFFEQFPTTKGALIFNGDLATLEEAVTLICSGGLIQEELKNTKKYVLGDFYGSSSSRFNSVLLRDLYPERYSLESPSSSQTKVHLLEAI